MLLPARPPATAPTAAPTTVPTGPATLPAAAPAATPPATAPTPVPTGCDPGAPVKGSRLDVPVLLLSFIAVSWKGWWNGRPRERGAGPLSGQAACLEQLHAR